MEIRCRKCNCTHNTGSSCCAKTVKICKDTAECKTFEKDAIKQAMIVQNNNLMRVAKSLKPKNTRSVPLTCDATDCLFNKCTCCIANGIVVEERAGCCATYCEN